MRDRFLSFYTYIYRIYTKAERRNSMQRRYIAARRVVSARMHFRAGYFFAAQQVQLPDTILTQKYYHAVAHTLISAPPKHYCISSLSSRGRGNTRGNCVPATKLR